MPPIRKLSNWLEAYAEYTEETESSPMFHRWVSLSMLSSVLRKKVWLSLGRIKVFPNMYVVLVAEPGIARKSQAISYGVDLLNEVPGIVLSADAVTKEAMLQDLEAGAVDEVMPNGTNFRHASLSIISKEFESFLGQRGENTKMLVLLTDLFDCQEVPWKYRTKNSGSNSIPSVFLNILGATTPDSLASCLPPSAIGGGLTSRVMFIWSSAKTKKIAIPVINDKIKRLREYLIHDLTIISRICGNFEFNQESIEAWTKWYESYDETSVNRICGDPSFNGWYSRKPLYIQKLAQILSAAESGSMTLEWKYFEGAIAEVEKVEHAMGRTFTAIGKSVIAVETELVMSIIRSHGSISEKQLMQMVWRDIDKTKLDAVIATVLSTGNFTRTFKGPADQPGVWYHSKND
jgi:hypothetical protein